MSLPAPPVSTLAALLPVRTLSDALPVPLIAPVPVNVRFSTSLLSVKRLVGEDRVEATARLLDNRVAGIDEIRIISIAADELIRPGPAVEHVVAAVAGQHVVQGIARRIDRRRRRSK